MYQSPPTNNLIRFGVIAEVDLAAARCRVQSGDLLTAPLPWLALRAGRTAHWSAPESGEQVVLLSPGGNISAAVVLLGIFSDANPAPAESASLHCVRFADGAVLEYDHEAHALRAALPAGGTVVIAAAGGITLTGNVAITGDVTISGKVEASGDVTGAGVSLVKHPHGAVTPGSGKSGPPA